MRDIDGSYGEGGGQLLRTACAIAAIAGESVRIFNVRARRDPPGLAPQHLTAVRAVAALCQGRVEGLALRSPEIAFYPGRARSGSYRFVVGTAGSLTLVLQAVMPVALASGGPVSLHLSGGTDVKASPPLDYFQHVLRPLLAEMGVRAEVHGIRRGYYPRGGGEVALAIHPSRLRALRREGAGALESIDGVAHVANLPEHIAARFRDTATSMLAGLAPVHIQASVLGADQAIGQGGALVLWARRRNALLGSAEVAQRGVSAERIAQNAATALRAEIECGATLDVHAADQVLIYCALAQGESRFLARELSSHAHTVLWLLQQFLPLKVSVHDEGGLARLALSVEAEFWRHDARRN